MRIKLQKNKQRELILSAKGIDSWTDLAIKLNTSPVYLRGDLKNEKILLSKEIYLQLCEIVHQDFNRYIIEEKNENWGRSKGGLSSKGSTKFLNVPPMNEKLAEFIGAVLGDGNINFYKKGKKIGVYQIKIAGDYKKDKKYHIEYLKGLSKELFNLDVKEILIPQHNERFLVLYSKELINFFKSMGLQPGNKIVNQSTIPTWIYTDQEYLKACIRGLIDTDGSIFRMSKQDPNLLRISFVNFNQTLLNDTRNILISLGFYPSKIILKKQFYLSRKKDISKYLKEIGFSNHKHKERIEHFKSLVV